MKKVSLGNSDIAIAPLVFGGNIFGWTVDKTQSFALLDALVDQGVNMVDTANVYSAWVPGHQGGESESIIGDWLQSSGKREQVVLASKVGMPMGDGSSGLSAANIVRSADASLKRLKTDYIDVYYAHLDDRDTPFAESLEAFQTLIESGKVRAIASSNYDADRLAECLQVAWDNGLPRFVAHQPEYNLYDRRGYEGKLEKVCKENGLGVVSYFSLASGFLSGKYRTAEDLASSARRTMVDKYLTDRGLAILAALDTIANRNQATLAATALAWIIHRDSVTAPIASATSMEQLQELVNGATLALSEDDMAMLNAASDD
ncbi:aldo/keto reductase [Parahaliea maris]|uniref:Aldo/keto reductase n=1 Tax=Parahaliea maris TaxID=2716870 RepID=A0A5C9A4T2_9GAMM|nr:aldo/keto reductase [Parahaliea maris]TXS95943.1 aldo/keto reductase [Parahaliea maris]